MRSLLGRAPEESRLFNPAFMATAAMFLAQGFRSEAGVGLPLPLAFVGCPLVTTTRLRSLLPRSTRTSMASWLQDHPEIRGQFPDLAMALVAPIRAGLLFGARRQAISISPQGEIRQSSLSANARATLRVAGPEVEDVVHRAEFVGRWFALAGPCPTILALWGVRP